MQGALLLTEVLKERDLQIEMKQRIAQMRHTDDHEELQRLQNAQIQSDQAEREKLEKKLKSVFLCPSPSRSTSSRLAGIERTSLSSNLHSALKSSRHENDGFISLFSFEKPSRIDQRKHQLMESRERESQEGVEYRRLAEQAEREHLERERHKMLAQKNVRTMYDKAVDDRNKVKQMEEQIDQVRGLEESAFARRATAGRG